MAVESYEIVALKIQTGRLNTQSLLRTEPEVFGLDAGRNNWIRVTTIGLGSPSGVKNRVRMVPL